MNNVYKNAQNACADIPLGATMLLGGIGSAEFPRTAFSPFRIGATMASK